MPALPEAPSVIRVHCEFELGSTHSGGSRFFMLYTGGPPTDSNLDTLATDVSTAFGTHLASAMSNDFDLVQVVCTDLTSGSAAEGSWTGSVSGTNSNGAVTIETCALINYSIARRYRGGKPKSFFPFGTVANLNPDLDTWNSSFVTTLESDWNAFITALTGLSGIGCTLTNQVNVSYYSGFASSQNPITKRWRNIPTPRTGDATIDNITAVTVSPLISQQRRRRLTPAAP